MAMQRQQPLSISSKLGLARRWTLRLGLALGSVVVTSVGLGFGLSSPVLAGDPSLGSDGVESGDKTEAAFKAMFEDGNYRDAEALLLEAQAQDPNEPLIYAMRALIAQYEKDDAQLPALAESTRNAAEAIKGDQPLRSHLYLAVAEFMEGANTLSEKGPVLGLGSALGRLRSFNESMDKARKINPDDPELNLIQGFTDMYASAYLPLSDTEDAVEKLKKAEPAYLGHWLTALGYRILEDNGAGIAAIDEGLKLQSEHAEMNYLKAQLEFLEGRHDSAQGYFTKALSAPEGMPIRLAIQILKESCENQEALDGRDRRCDKGGVKAHVKEAAREETRWAENLDESFALKCLLAEKSETEKSEIRNSGVPHTSCQI